MGLFISLRQLSCCAILLISSNGKRWSSMARASESHAGWRGAKAPSSCKSNSSVCIFIFRCFDFCLFDCYGLCLRSLQPISREFMLGAFARIVYQFSFDRIVLEIKRVTNHKLLSLDSCEVADFYQTVIP